MTEPSVSLPWLVRLRWLFIAGQLVALPLAQLLVGVRIRWWVFAPVLAVGAISNALLARRPISRHDRVIGSVLVLDIGLLTVELAALGGATNPFAIFYLVYITLSALVLGARWTTAITALAIASYALLFLVPAEIHVHHVGSPFSNPHLQGMWTAFVVAALLVGFFARRITQAIAAQREQIATLRENAARNARLASLATLAAGAAHELNSPLSTIAIAAHEAALRARSSNDAKALADLDLILEEVDRCQTILHRMSARATGTDSVRTIDLAAIAETVRAELGPRVDITVHGESSLAVPSEPLVQSLLALVKNALDASSERVEVQLKHADGRIEITIADRGAGMDPEVLAKVGEPFFTTKAPGAGMGLGVFLARHFVESRGGALAITSIPGTGTTATVTLPV